MDSIYYVGEPVVIVKLKGGGKCAIPLVTGVSTIIPRAIFAGGYQNTTIDYVEFGTLGNATDFGDLTVGRFSGGSCASTTRGIIAGGNLDGTSESNTNIIDYITISTAGNAIDFGDLTVSRWGLSGCSNTTRGVFAGGAIDLDSMDYVTIVTTGNASNFGSLISGRYEIASCASTTRGIFAGGYYTTPIIEYITIATECNGSDFGSLTSSRRKLAGCSNTTRGVFAGGKLDTNTSVIDYITIATAGNASNFGSLTTSSYLHLSGAASTTRALFAGGGSWVYGTTDIHYVDIATTTNSSDFGDLTVARSAIAGISNCHGGL